MFKCLLCNVHRVSTALNGKHRNIKLTAHNLKLFYGSGTALVTPFAGDQVDYGAWHRLIEGQLARGVDALVVLG